MLNSQIKMNSHGHRTSSNSYQLSPKLPKANQSLKPNIALLQNGNGNSDIDSQREDILKLKEEIYTQKAEIVNLKHQNRKYEEETKLNKKVINDILLEVDKQSGEGIAMIIKGQLPPVNAHPQIALTSDQKDSLKGLTNDNSHCILSEVNQSSEERDRKLMTAGNGNQYMRNIAEMSALKQENNSIKFQLEDLSRKYRDVSERNRKLYEQMTNAKKNYHELRDKQKENDIFAKKLQGYREKENSNLRKFYQLQKNGNTVTNNRLSSRNEGDALRLLNDAETAKEVKEEISRLKQKITALNTQGSIREMEMEKKYAEKLSIEKDKLVKANETISNMQAQQKEISIQNKKAESDCVQLRAENGELKLNIEEKTKQISKQKEEVKKLEGKIKTIEEKHTKKLKELIEQTEEDQRRLKLSELKAVSQAQNEERKELLAKMASLEEENKKMNSKHLSLDNDKKEVEKSIEQLEKENKQLKKSLKDLTEEKNQKQSHQAQAEKNSENLTLLTQKITQEKEDFRSQLELMTQEKEKLEKRIEVIEAEHEKLLRINKDLNEEISKKRIDTNENEGKNKELKQKIELVEEDNFTLKEMIKRYETEKIEVMSKLELKDTEKEELVTQLEEKNKKNKSDNDELIIIKEELAKVKEDQAQLESDYQIRKNNHSQLEKEYNALKDHNEQIVKENNEIKKAHQEEKTQSYHYQQSHSSESFKDKEPLMITQENRFKFKAQKKKKEDQLDNKAAQEQEDKHKKELERREQILKEDNHTLKASMKEREANYFFIEKTNKTLTTTLNQLEQEINQLKTDKEDLLKQYSNKERELQKEKSKAKEAKEEQEANEEPNLPTLKNLISEDKEDNYYQQQVNGLQQTITTLQQQNESLTQLKKQFDLEKTSLKAEMTELKEKNISLEDQYRKNKEANTKMQFESEMINQNYSTLQEESNELKQQQIELKKEFQERNQKIKQMQKEGDELIRNNKSLTEQIALLSKGNEDFESKTKANMEEKDKMLSDIIALKEEISQLLHQNEESKTEMTSLKDKLTEMKEENVTMKNQLKETKLFLKQSNEEVNQMPSLKAKLTQMETELERQAEERKKLVQTIQEKEKLLQQKSQTDQVSLHKDKLKPIKLIPSRESQLEFSAVPRKGVQNRTATEEISNSIKQKKSLKGQAETPTPGPSSELLKGKNINDITEEDIMLLDDYIREYDERLNEEMIKSDVLQQIAEKEQAKYRSMRDKYAKAKEQVASLTEQLYHYQHQMQTPPMKKEDKEDKAEELNNNEELGQIKRAGERRETFSPTNNENGNDSDYSNERSVHHGMSDLSISAVHKSQTDLVEKEGKKKTEKADEEFDISDNQKPSQDGKHHKKINFLLDDQNEHNPGLKSNVKTKNVFDRQLSDIKPEQQFFKKPTDNDSFKNFSIQFFDQKRETAKFPNEFESTPQHQQKDEAHFVKGFTLKENQDSHFSLKHQISEKKAESKESFGSIDQFNGTDENNESDEESDSSALSPKQEKESHNSNIKIHSIYQS